MNYSIIVAVYNRLQEVKELLVSAENMKFSRDEFEILFVDDGSNDGFKEFIQNYNSGSNLNIRAVYQENAGPGAARNYGMDIARGNYFIFVDSDCMFPPQWLGEIDLSVKENNWDAFGGPDTYHESFSPLLKAINYSMTSIVGTGGTRGHKKGIGKFYPRSFNMGIRRKVYEKVGKMGGLRHGQDMDYSQRIFDAGFKVGLIPDAYIYHKRRTDLAKFYRQIFNWGIARINLANKHPNMLKIIHLLPAFVILGLIFVVLMVVIAPKFGVPLAIFTLFAYLMVNIWAFTESFIKYKELKAALLSPITLNIQVFAYGFGLISALWQTKVLKKKEAKGFVKRYYGK